jgi:hypothetical protein
MRRVVLGLVTVPAMGLALAGCSTWNPAPPVGGAPPASPRAERQVLQAGIAETMPFISQCYRLTTERVLFKVLRTVTDDRDRWNAIARAVNPACKDSQVWDNQYYYYRLAPDETLMLLYKNIDTERYGYMVIKNAPTLWLVYTNNTGPFVVKNGETFTRSWTSDGRRIRMHVYNPNNAGDWTPNDIWVSFSH